MLLWPAVRTVWVCCFFKQNTILKVECNLEFFDHFLDNKLVTVITSEERGGWNNSLSNNECCHTFSVYLATVIRRLSNPYNDFIKTHFYTNQNYLRPTLVSERIKWKTIGFNCVDTVATSLFSYWTILDTVFCDVKC